MDRRAIWLVTGATGLVGRYVMAAATQAGVRAIGTSRRGGGGVRPMDLRDSYALGHLLESVQPDFVVHLAAIAKPAEVDARLDEANLVNVEATRRIAAWCAERGRHLTFASTDHVFGQGRGPHLESGKALPITPYGMMKLEGERAVEAAGGLVVRLGWVLDDSPGSTTDYIGRSLEQMRAGHPVFAVDDEWRTPVHTSALGQMVRDLAGQKNVGTIHVAGPTHSTPYRVLKARARHLGLDTRLIQKTSGRCLFGAERPADVRLNTRRLQDVLQRNRSIVA